MKQFILLFSLLFSFQTFSQCLGNEPVISLGNDTIVCPGQPVVLHAAAGFDYYIWSTGSLQDSITVNAPGTYSVLGGIVGTNLIVHGDFQGGTTALANGFTSSYIAGTGGSYGLLSNPGQFAIATSPSLTHNDFMFCGDHTTGTGNMLIANGASSANTNVWSKTIPVTPGTNYVFSFWQMNVLHTTAVSNLQLYINSAPISAIVPTSTSACVWVENSGVWNSGTATQAVLSIVNQSVLSSGNDFAIDDIFFAPVCASVDTIVVTHDVFTVDAGADILFCANETADLSATASVPVSAWSWSSGQTTAQITPTSSGVYTATATSLNGCSVSDAVNVTITPMNWNIDTILMGPTDCGVNNGYVSVVATGSFLDPPFYTWTGPGSGNPNQINASVWSDLSPGWYYISIESANCYRYDSVQVVPNNPAIASVSANPISGVYPLTVDFANNSQNGSSYAWDFGNGNTANVPGLTSQTQIYDTSGVYTIQLIAENGDCSDTTYVTITVTDPPIIPPVVEVNLETSNVFTPNGDAINDVFQFKMENIISLDLTILNRWGQTVYNSSVLNAEWNGDMSNGLPAEEGVYFYIYSAVGKQNEALSGHGFVHLVR